MLQSVIMRRAQARQELAKDLIFIVTGAFIAVILSASGFIHLAIDFFGSLPIASFISGIFFTSVFTVAPASVAFASLTSTGSPHLVAIWGGLGAMCGDLILFFFIRDRFTDDLMNSLKPRLAKRFLSSFHLGFLKWISPFLGAIIIASPLPDEFGLTLMGLSKVRIAVLMPISFVMNTFGIYLIAWFAKLIA